MEGEHVTLHALGAQNYRQRQTGFFQNGTLFDVQFQIRSRVFALFFRIADPR